MTDWDRSWQYYAGFDYQEVYELENIDLTPYTGIIVSASCDQIFLAKHGDILEQWVKDGGTLLVNGHPVHPFLTDMPSWRKLYFHGVNDIWLHTTGRHPIWDGVDMRGLLLRTGVPGEHSFEELLKIGVGGFYARNYLVNLPGNAHVIVGIGEGKLPVDVAYPYGRGEVIMHCGMDVDFFNPEFFDTPVDMRARVAQYLGGTGKEEVK